MNLARQHGSSSSLPIPHCQPQLSCSRALTTPLPSTHPPLLFHDQNVNLCMHAKSSCLNAWSDSTLGGCGRYTGDRLSKQPLGARPRVYVCPGLQMCVCHVRARSFDHTSREGAPWTLGCFGREINFCAGAERVDCCKVNGSKVSIRTNCSIKERCCTMTLGEGLEMSN